MEDRDKAMVEAVLAIWIAIFLTCGAFVSNWNKDDG